MIPAFLPTVKYTRFVYAALALGHTIILPDQSVVARLRSLGENLALSHS